MLPFYLKTKVVGIIWKGKWWWSPDLFGAGENVRKGKCFVEMFR